MINVVAGILVNDSGKILTAKRNYGDLNDKWEFPGGKLETGETWQEALQREFKEELNLEVSVEKFITEKVFNNLRIQYYICKSKSLKDLNLTAHDNVKWLDRNSLYSVDWLSTDLEILHEIEGGLST